MKTETKEGAAASEYYAVHHDKYDLTNSTDIFRLMEDFTKRVIESNPKVEEVSKDNIKDFLKKQGIKGSSVIPITTSSSGIIRIDSLLQMFAESQLSNIKKEGKPMEGVKQYYCPVFKSDVCVGHMGEGDCRC